MLTWYRLSIFIFADRAGLMGLLHDWMFRFDPSQVGVTGTSSDPWKVEVAVIKMILVINDLINGSTVIYSNLQYSNQKSDVISD